MYLSPGFILPPSRVLWVLQRTSSSPSPSLEVVLDYSSRYQGWLCPELVQYFLPPPRSSSISFMLQHTHMWGASPVLQVDTALSTSGGEGHALGVLHIPKACPQLLDKHLGIRCLACTNRVVCVCVIGQ